MLAILLALGLAEYRQIQFEAYAGLGCTSTTIAATSTPQYHTAVVSVKSFVGTIALLIPDCLV